MAQSFLVDTDVFVDFLRGQPAAVSFVQSHADGIALSAVTVAELYAGARNREEEQRLAEAIKLLPVHAITPELAREAGLLKRRFGKSHGRGIGDALIAVTARTHGLALATLNTRHYPMFEGLRPPYRKA